MIKCSSDNILNIILQFFNLNLSKGLVSSSWCKGIINPIHKEGDKSNPENYRGICIMNSLQKILCMMLNNRIVSFLLDKDVINKCQIGFMKGNRTTDHIMTLKAIVNKYVHDKNEKIYACFVDFKKAFDSINQHKMFYKLQRTGINGKILNLLRNIYDKSYCSLKINDKLTQHFKYEKGVLQGNPLSPILFNVYINDLFVELSKVNDSPVTLNDKDKIFALMFADDLIILSTSKNGLQKSLDKLDLYCKKWDLEVNLKKTKCMTFKKGNKVDNTSFLYRNTNIEHVKVFKYLGLSINFKGNFLPTVQDLSNKANKAIYSLNNKIDLKYLSPNLKLKLFDYLICPILLYGSEIWFPFIYQSSKKWDECAIEKVHLSYMKRILGVNRSTTNVLVRAELGRLALKDKCLLRNLNYIKYLNKKDNNTIVKQAFNCEIRNFDKRNTVLKTIAEFNEKLDETTNRHINIIQMPLTETKKHVRKISIEEWKSSFQGSTKADSYRLFKTIPKMETYLEHFEDIRYVKTLSKFRLSDHKLVIEEGRRVRPNINIEDRKCVDCKVIGDRVHFLIDCGLSGLGQGRVCDLQN